MFCVFVLNTSLSQDRLTEWVYSSVSTGWYRLSIHWFPQVTSWIFPTQRPFSVWVWGWVVSSVGIISKGDAWWLQLVSKSWAWHWTRYRDVLMEFSVNIRCPCWPVLLRNLCGTRPKDPRQQSSKPEKWKVHDISFSKHQKLLKNSSWAQSYDDLKKVRFFLTHSEQKAGNPCWPKIWQWCLKNVFRAQGCVVRST